MSRAFLNARWATPAAALLLAAACATQKPMVAPPPPAPPPLDASYDWHVLVVAPFGSVLKDIPLGLHEVLLFRDAQSPASSADEPECYAVNGTGPRFIARAPSEYLLCFKHDRLSRIEATVRLPENEAHQIFADACGLWAKSAQAPNAEAPNTDGCQGADGGVAFAARIETAPEEEDTQLIIQLDAADLASDAAAARAPDR
jgi:hypothetical protein